MPKSDPIALSRLADPDREQPPVAGSERARRNLAAEAAHLYQGMFENAVWGIFQTTPDGRYLNANPALARIYGYESASSLLEAFTDIGRQLYVDPERRNDFIRLMHENGVVQGFESEIFRRDGSIIWISESCREVRTSGGELLYYEGTVEEITARKRAEDELVKAKETAEAANRSKTEFLATMSHELRTPLNAIIGFAEMIRSECLGPIGLAEYRDYAEDIHQSGEHLLAIISDILDFVKAENGSLRLAAEEVDLGALTLRLGQLFQEAAAAKAIRLTAAASAEGLKVQGDERRLAQILRSLLENAIKFTPKGGAVAVEATRSGKLITVEVKDTGIGIAEPELGRVLEPFHQADGSFARRHEGTGLGLSICDRLVRLHGGSLSLSSEVGKGTTVRVTLPACPA